MNSLLASPRSAAASAASPARQALGAVPWLAAVPASTLDALAARAMLHRLPAGALAFEQAETPAFAQFLVSGSLKLTGLRADAEAVIDIARPFDLVLPAAALTGQPYLLRGRVLEEAQLVLVAADVFRAALASDALLCGAVLGFVSLQLRRQLRAAKSFRLRSAEERVAAYLSDLVVDAGGRVELTLPVEKSEIASQLGMTRETFSRTLAALAAQGVRADGRRVVIADFAAFRARFPRDPFIDGAD